MRRSVLTPYLLIAPSLIFLLLLFFVPLVQTIALAFQTGTGFGLGKFAQVVNDLDFVSAIMPAHRRAAAAPPDRRMSPRG